ncbi:MAG: hypothetical protein QOJ19_1170 [Acidimicrobiia bacterium]|nr:hypothetical protein [Acidimicrobiia bacterium]
MLSYVVPLRRWSLGSIDELATYLRALTDIAEVIVVDGSDAPIFEHHGRTLTAPIRHLPVGPQFHGRSGKVNGVLTGVSVASHERVVLADDDVRYDAAELQRVAELLEDAHLVRPQNYFDPRPWHARWDTARSLLNRCFAGDFPGTLAVRRSALLATGGYDADVLFENLELMRTIETAGGVVRHAPELYIRRAPPSTGQFLRQRVRQAYDSSATPGRMLVELLLLPVLLFALRASAFRALCGGIISLVALAERGRRRAGGRRVFPATCSLFAPAWALERAICAWCALATRARGGVPYAGTRFARAATPRGELRRRYRHVQLKLEGALA